LVFQTVPSIHGSQIRIMTEVTHSLSPEAVEEIQRTFQYCSKETIQAIITFRSSGDPSVVPTIVFGIIEREAPKKSAEALKHATDDSRFLEDLEIDSLTMLEIVLGIEEALNVKIEDSELRGIQTLGDVNRFLATKIHTSPGRSESGTALASTTVYSREQVLAILPQQPPFLFVDKAERQGNTIHASYLVRGDEDCLKGHFKGNPIFPASLVFEALGQAGCLWILVSESLAASLPVGGEILFASLEGAHFHSKVRGGDLLDIRVEMTKLRAPVAIFRGEVTCHGRLVAKVERLMLAFGDLAGETGETVESEDAPPAL
jgi:3-hydroxyacyl-[acyl-carrier-protein] dehydratase